MKRIMQGCVRVKSQGYQSLLDILRRNLKTHTLSPYYSYRFWFYPVPLSKGEVHLSGDGRTVLFKTRVELLTEEMMLTGDGFTSTGTVDQFSHLAAGLFTEHYSKFETSDQILPHGIFRQLHTLVDIVTLCKIWRSMNFDSPLLEQFASLPVRSVKVPAYYPGITVRVGEAARRDYTLSGGVYARSRITSRSLDFYDSVDMLLLRDAVRVLHAKDGFVHTLDFALSLAVPEVGGEGDVERLLSAGLVALAERKYADAKANFENATQKEPLRSEAWAYLAVVQSVLNEHNQAKRSVANALKQDPTDPMFRHIELDVWLKGDLGLDLNQGRWSESAKRELSYLYAERAYAAALQGELNQACDDADVAIRLWPGNADAYLARGLAQITLADFKQAIRDLLQARKRYRRLLKDQDVQGANSRIALALALSAYARMVSVSRAITDEKERELADRELERAVRESQEARTFDDSLALATAVEAQSRATRVLLFRLMGLQGNMSVANQRANTAIAQFPDFPHAYFARAWISFLEEDFGKAIEDLSKALALDPTFGEGFYLRAIIHKERKDWRTALIDFERVLELLPERNSEIECEINNLRRKVRN